MKKQTIHYTKTIPALLMALSMSCFSSLTAQGGGGRGTEGGAIIGLWHLVYSGDLQFESFDQYHSDGLEFEVSNIAPGAICQGIWQQTGSRNIQVFHTGYNYDGTYFRETQTLTVSPDRQSYDGTYEIRDIDGTGCIDDLTGTLHADRLSVNTDLCPMSAAR